MEIDIKNTAITLIKSGGVEKETAESLEKLFIPYFTQVSEWKTKAMAIVVTDENQLDLMKQARESRLLIKNIRTSVEKTRVALKEDSLRKGKLIDGIARLLKGALEPIESHLDRQENFTKYKEQERRTELLKKRIRELSEYGADIDGINIALMTESEFAEFKEFCKQDKKAKEEKLRQEEKLRKEEEQEKERLRQENEKLRQQLADQKPVLGSIISMSRGDQTVSADSEIDSLRNFADYLLSIEPPEVTDKKLKKISSNAKDLLVKTSEYIKTQINFHDKPENI